jgi:MtN3 and saliva related transmembrane protein
MIWQELLGLIAGAFTSLALVPQVWCLYKLKSAREISLAFTTLFLIGTACWFTYGVLLVLLPVIFWNSINLFLAAAMLFAKLKYGRK